MTYKIWFVLSLSCFFFLSHSQEGNYKYNNFGNRSILLAGNVTGTASDLGLTYYNPSFLANAKNVGFSLNARAYQVSNFKLKSPNTENAELSSTDFNNSSTMAGGIFNLFKTRFAYSYLTKSNFNTNIDYSISYLNDDILEEFPEAISHKAKVGLNSHIRDDWTGASWAYKINDNFSAGVSAFVSIYKNDGISLLSHIVESSDNNIAFYQNSVSYNQKSYGLFLKLGANYLFPKFQVGLNVNLPYLEVIKDGSYGYSKVISGAGSENNTAIEYNFENLDSKRKEPLGVSVGAGIPFTNGKIHLNVDFVSGLKNYDKIVIPDIDTGTGSPTPVYFDESRNAVINFGFGAEYRLNDKLKGYAGFSTDFNAIKTSANIVNITVDENKRFNGGDDLYHLSLGVDWKLKWLNIITGITNSSGAKSFISPYSIDFGDSPNSNETNSELKYTRWQFVIGVDVPILNKNAQNEGRNN